MSARRRNSESAAYYLKSAVAVKENEKFRKEFMESSFGGGEGVRSAARTHSAKERPRIHSAKERPRMHSAKERPRNHSAKVRTASAKGVRCQQRHGSVKIQDPPNTRSCDDICKLKQEDDEDNPKYTQATSISDSQSVPFLNQVNCPSSIEQVIMAFKAEATRRLRPALLESIKLKSQASPSVKRFLEVYDRPTAIDKFTGKPIPLRYIYEQEISERKNQGTALSIMNKAMGNIARQTEARAEVILMRSDPYHNNLTEKDRFWSCDLPGLIDDIPQTMPVVPLSKKMLSGPKRVKQKPSIKGTKLPIYLMAKGDVRAPSLEWYGKDMVYCTPSHERPETDTAIITDEEQTRIRERQLIHSHTPDRFFLTENRYSSQGRPLSTSWSRLGYYKGSLRTPSKSLRLRGWQPLTKSALLEHTRVSEVPVAKKGTYCHNVQNREHQQWHPEEATTSASSSEVHQGCLDDSMDCMNRYNCIGFTEASSKFYSKYSNMYKQFFGFPSEV